MKESKIDTQRFGFKVGKTNGEVFKHTPLDKFKQEGYKLIIARVNLEDIKLINLMEDLGFRIKDTQITYKHSLSNIQNIENFIPLVSIREFKESDTPILVQMAKDSFNNYGHYFNNSNLDKQKCLEVYADWAYNSCTNPDVADKILVAYENDILLGYLSFKIYNTPEGKKYAAGGMGAVDPNYRGRNIFPQILKKGLEWSHKTQLDWCEHNVIVNNFPVNRSMNKLGFKPSLPVVTMHCWIN